MRYESQLAQLVAEGLDSKCLEPPAPLPSSWHHRPNNLFFFYFRAVVLNFSDAVAV